MNLEIAFAAVSLSIAATDWIVEAGGGAVRVADTCRLVLFIEGTDSIPWTVDVGTGQTYM